MFSQSFYGSLEPGTPSHNTTILSKPVRPLSFHKIALVTIWFRISSIESEISARESLGALFPGSLRSDPHGLAATDIESKHGSDVFCCFRLDGWLRVGG